MVTLRTLNDNIVHTLILKSLDFAVTLEESSLRISEGAGFAEVCAVLSNPASQPVNALLSARMRNPVDAKG